MEPRKAVYGGSFDPVTNGHMHIIKKAAELFDELVIVVAPNPAKSPMFNQNERMRMIHQALMDEDLRNVSVEKLMGDEYLVDFACGIGAGYLVRGLANTSDFTFERDIHHANRNINSNMQTVFLMCDQKVEQVRSSTVRMLYGPKGWANTIKPMVPESVFKVLIVNHMERRWKSFAYSIGMSQGNAEKEWQQLRSRYENRPFHSFFHILNMLEAAENKKLRGLIENFDAMILAVWYHDVWVDSDDRMFGTGIGSAERASAEEIRKIVHVYDRAVIELAYDMVMATAHGVRDPKTTDEKIIAGIDLMSLSIPEEKYFRAVEYLEDEYLKTRCNPQEFNGGRVQFLKKMLAKDRIFPDMTVFVWEEENARRNMEKELSMRTSGESFGETLNVQKIQ